MKRQIKELRQLVIRVINEIRRRKHLRNATHKGKRIKEELKRKANSNLSSKRNMVRQIKPKDCENGEIQRKR